MSGSFEDLDAVVIGGNVRGLVTAYLLDRLGYRSALVERAPRLGGTDGSFTTPGGAVFDFGLHLLDEMRSEVTTRLFTHVIGGAVQRARLQRGIVLRGHLMPYAPHPAEMPAELRAMLPGDELADDLGDALPTRERLARCYGRAFTDLVFDEVLPSFPAENRHRALGVDEARLLVNVYPWFFPAVRERAPSRDVSRAFHDRLRAGIPQHVLYPREGGFGGFAAAFARSLDSARTEVLTGATDAALEIEPGTHAARCAVADGHRLRAPRYFWAASWTELCRTLAIPWPEVATDRVLLGSFVLDRPAAAANDFHEILVGDPAYRINRAWFPGSLRRPEEPLLQIEYAVPEADGPPLDGAFWRAAWEDEARRLGILQADCRVVEFDFKAVRLHFNGFGVEGQPLRDADPGLIAPGSNVHPVVPSLANLNLNAYVPRTVHEVCGVLAGTDLP